MTVTTMNPPGTFAWIELGTTDGPGAKEFYTKLFGWDVKETPMGPDFTYYIFQMGGQDVAAMYQLMPDQLKVGVPPHWMSYIAVASADEAAAKVTSLGGTIISQPFDVGTHGRMALFTDPQGAHFAVWQSGDNGGIGKRGEPGALVWNELSTTDIKAGSALMSSPSHSAPAESWRAPGRTARCRRPAQSLRMRARWSWRSARRHRHPRARPRHRSSP